MDIKKYAPWVLTSILFINQIGLYVRPEQQAQAEIRCQQYTNDKVTEAIKTLKEDLIKYFDTRFDDLQRTLDK